MPPRLLLLLITTASVLLPACTTTVENESEINPVRASMVANSGISTADLIRKATPYSVKQFDRRIDPAAVELISALEVEQWLDAEKLVSPENSEYYRSVLKDILSSSSFRAIRIEGLNTRCASDPAVIFIDLTSANGRAETDTTGLFLKSGCGENNRTHGCAGCEGTTVEGAHGACPCDHENSAHPCGICN